MSLSEVRRYYCGSHNYVWLAVVFDRVTGCPVKWSDAYDCKSRANDAAASYRAELGDDFTVSVLDAYCAD